MVVSVSETSSGRPGSSQLGSASFCLPVRRQGVTRLCVFLQRQSTNDMLLPLLITFLNDRDPGLRCAFFGAITGVCAFVGRASLQAFVLPSPRSGVPPPLLSQWCAPSLQAFVLPCILQALTDVEESVVSAALQSLCRLAEVSLHARASLLDITPPHLRLYTPSPPSIHPLTSFSTPLTSFSTSHLPPSLHPLTSFSTSPHHPLYFALGEPARAGVGARHRRQWCAPSPHSGVPPPHEQVSLHARASVLDIAAKIAPLLCHPNSWVRHGALGFFGAIDAQFGAAHVFCFVRPLLRPFLAAGQHGQSGRLGGVTAGHHGLL